MEPEEISQSNFREKMNISVEATMDCYISDENWKFVSLPQFLVQRRMKTSGLDYDL